MPTGGTTGHCEPTYSEGHCGPGAVSSWGHETAPKSNQPDQTSREASHADYLCPRLALGQSRSVLSPNRSLWFSQKRQAASAEAAGKIRSTEPVSSDNFDNSFMVDFYNNFDFIKITALGRGPGGSGGWSIAFYSKGLRDWGSEATNQCFPPPLSAFLSL